MKINSNIIYLYERILLIIKICQKKNSLIHHIVLT